MTKNDELTKKKLEAKKRLAKTTQMLKDKSKNKNPKKQPSVQDTVEQNKRNSSYLQAQINEIRPLLTQHDITLQNIQQALNNQKQMIDNHGQLISDILLLMDVEDTIEAPKEPEVIPVKELVEPKEDKIEKVEEELGEGV